jgi:hypothetical protein
MRNCLEFLGVPVRILFLHVPEILRGLYVVLEVLQSMLKSILEDIDIPVVRPAFVPIDHMDQNLQLGFIGIILQYLDNLSLGNILILDRQPTLYLLLHLLRHEVKSLHLRHELNELLLKLYLLLLYEQLLQLLRILHPLAHLEAILLNDISIVADNRLQLQLFLHLLLLPLDLHLHLLVLGLSLYLYRVHLVLELEDLLLLQS